MSLVGPRPERTEFTPELSRVIPNYQRRLLVRPGVTGLAQVQLPPDTDLESVRAKLRYDLWYIEHASLWLDMRLILCTAMKVFFLPMPLFCRLLRIPGANVVEPCHGVIDIPSPVPTIQGVAAFDPSAQLPDPVQLKSKMVLEKAR